MHDALPAKLSPPELYGVLRRERLFRLLDRARRQRVVWVCGAPGSGKTALLASYLATRRLSALWYRMDAGDRDPGTFFYYLGRGAARLTSGRRSPLPLLTPEADADLAGFARRYFRDLYGRLRRGAVLVFDNLHEVLDDARAVEMWPVAFGEIPSGVSVLVASRHEPPSEFMRLRSTHGLTVLGWDQLRLRLDETRGIAGRRRRIDAATLRALHARAGGWAAGLTLMLGHDRPGGDRSVPAPTSQDAVFDYFAAEIFDRAGSDLQYLLTTTAFLPVVTPGAAEQLAGRAGAGVMLATLYRRQFFLERRPHPEAGYAYHALFREFLLRRAREMFPAEQLRDIQLRAARLLEAHDDPASALTLHVAIQNWADARQLVLREAPQLLAQGRWQTLESWIRRLPSKVVEAAPWLSFWLGESLLRARPAEARTPLGEAFRRFVEGGDLDGQLTTAAAIVESHIFERSGYDGLDPWLRHLDRLLGEGVAFPSLEEELRVHTALLAGLVYRWPDHAGIPALADRVLSMFEGEFSANRKLAVAAFLGKTFWWMGNVTACERVAAAVRPLVDDPRLSPLTRAASHKLLINEHYLRADHGRAAAVADGALAVARSEGLDYFERTVDIYQVWNSIGAGTLDHATAQLAALWPRLSPTRHMDMALAHFAKCWMALLRDDAFAAEGHAVTTLCEARAAGMPLMERYAQLALAYARVEQGKEDAEATTAASSRTTAGAAFRLLEFQERLVAAGIALRRGGRDMAATPLRDALRVGREEQFVTAFMWLPELMVRVCSAALALGIEVDYVRRLIHARQLLPTGPELEHWPWPVRVYTLGRFTVIRDGESPHPERKAHRRPYQVLQAVIAMGGENAAADAVASAIWPEAEADAATKALETTIARLRTLLGSRDAMTLHEGKLALDPRRVWVDVWAVARLLARARDGGRAAGNDAERERLAGEIVRLYAGDFLATERDQPWMVTTRERLRSGFLRFLLSEGRAHMSAGRWMPAIDLYRRGLEVEPTAEELYRELMRCHRDRGEDAEVARTYRRCERVLAAVLRIRPARETEAVFRGRPPKQGYD